MMSTISVSVDNNFEPQSTLVWFSLPQSNSSKKPICLCQPQFARKITFEKSIIEIKLHVCRKAHWHDAVESTCKWSKVWAL